MLSNKVMFAEQHCVEGWEDSALSATLLSLAVFNYAELCCSHNQSPKRMLRCTWWDLTLLTAVSRPCICLEHRWQRQAICVHAHLSDLQAGGSSIRINCFQLQLTVLCSVSADTCRTGYIHQSQVQDCGCSDRAVRGSLH